MTGKNHRTIERHIERFLEHLQCDKISNVNSDHIREYIFEMKGLLGWEPGTVRSHLQSFRSFYSWCVKRGYVKNNPALGIEKPKLPSRLPRCLTRDQAEKIMAFCSLCDWISPFAKSRNSLILKTFLCTGLRLNELLKLQITDIDLQDKLLRVKQGKGRKDRNIPIHPSLEVELRKYFAEMRRINKLSKWVFPSLHTDKRLYERDVRDICKRVGSKCGIYFTPHMLRHTFARLAVDGDLNVFKLKEILGHSNISTTQIYMSVSTKALANGFNKIELV